MIRFKPIITGDVFGTRGMAYAAAACLRSQGWNSKVEASGPNPPEYRVITTRADGLIAYFHEGDRLDAYEPHWIAP